MPVLIFSVSSLLAAILSYWLTKHFASLLRIYVPRVWWKATATTTQTNRRWLPKSWQCWVRRNFNACFYFSCKSFDVHLQIWMAEFLHMLFAYDNNKADFPTAKVIPQKDKDQSGHDSDSRYEFNTWQTEFLLASHLFTCSSVYNVCTRK